MASTGNPKALVVWTRVMIGWPFPERLRFFGNVWKGSLYPAGCGKSSRRPVAPSE